MGVTAFDHVALPTADAARLLAFYRRLGFGVLGEEEWRAGTGVACAITFGDQKINVHPETMVAMRGRPEYLRAPAAEPGCGDICFVWEGGIGALQAKLNEAGVMPIEGPVPRRGGRAGGGTRGVSVYARDPDDNLIEFISYDPEDIATYRRRARPEGESEQTAATAT
jgi:catechol 2,3-dioxygenase-like lactoylglutathione lyase family enzyme